MPGQPQADQRQEKGRLKPNWSRDRDDRTTGSLSAQCRAQIDVFDATKMIWLVGAHLAFVISAFLLVLSDRLGSDYGREK
jgi:hypothetical protein